MMSTSVTNAADMVEVLPLISVRIAWDVLHQADMYYNGTSDLPAIYTAISKTDKVAEWSVTRKDGITGLVYYTVKRIK